MFQTREQPRPAQALCLEQESSIGAARVYGPLEGYCDSLRVSFCRLIVAVVVLLFELLAARTTLPAQLRQPPSALQAVDRMVQAETAAWKNRQHFLYRQEERSNRTKGHLWGELVVETSDGRMQRLISEDGKPLSGSQKQAEDERIAYLVDHPDEFRREAQRRTEDEARMPELLKEIPNVFLFRIVGAEGDYTRIAFQPNPSFQEKSYQDRVVHAMSGVLRIHTPDMRLCGLDAHLDHKVEFGFGFLGELRDETRFSLARQEVSPGHWKTTKVQVHLDGTILLLKSLSRDEDSSHYGFRSVARDLTVAEAAAIVRSDAF